MHAVTTTSATPATRPRLTWFMFASPANFYRLAGVLGPAFGVIAAAFALAGRGLSHHLHPRAGGLAVDGAVHGDGLLGRHRLVPQRPHGLHPGPRDRAHRRPLHAAGAVDGLAVGAADL